MKKKNNKALYFGFLLILSTTIQSCTTVIGVGGNAELCIEDDNQMSYVLYDENDDNTVWMDIFHEGEMGEDYEE